MLIQGGYHYVIELLSVKMGDYSLNSTTRTIIALVVLPIVAGLILRFAYWLTKRSPSAVIPGVAWGVWLVLVTMLAVKAA